MRHDGHFSDRSIRFYLFSSVAIVSASRTHQRGAQPARAIILPTGAKCWNTTVGFFDQLWDLLNEFVPATRTFIFAQSAITYKNRPTTTPRSAANLKPGKYALRDRYTVDAADNPKTGHAREPRNAVIQ